MKFIQPCFIRKNTPELRKKLEKLGMKRYPRFIADWDDNGTDKEYLCCDIMWYTYSKVPTVCKAGSFIDCGTNEEMFLALAALTDSKYGILEHYMVTTSCGPYMKGVIYPCLPIMSSIHPECYRKATVQEIVKHFKKKAKTE